MIMRIEHKLMEDAGKDSLTLITCESLISSIHIWAYHSSKIIQRYVCRTSQRRLIRLDWLPSQPTQPAPVVHLLHKAAMQQMMRMMLWLGNISIRSMLERIWQSYLTAWFDLNDLVSICVDCSEL